MNVKENEVSVQFPENIGFIRVTRGRTMLEYAFICEGGFVTFIGENGGKLVSKESDTADIKRIKACVREAIRRVGGFPWGDPRNRVKNAFKSRMVEMPPCIGEETIDSLLDYIRHEGRERED